MDFTPIKREVIVTFTNDKTHTIYTALSFADIKGSIFSGRKIKSINNRF